MTNSVPDSVLHSQLQQALIHLYDPVYLGNNALIERLRLSRHSNPASSLRQILTETIETLEPDEDVPAHTNMARYYQILYQRYIEQFPQQEVATDLGLSVRQLRRLEKASLTLLEEQLRETWGALLDEFPKQEWMAPDDGGSIDDPATPSQAEEIRWSQKVIANETVSVAEFVRATLEIAEPLVDSLAINVVQSISPSLPCLDVQMISARQALLSIITTAASRTPGGQLEIAATAQEDHVEFRFMLRNAEDTTLSWTRDDIENFRMSQALVELSSGQLTLLDANADQSERLDSVNNSLMINLSFPAENRVTVLVVDDNPDTLKLLERYVLGTRYHLVGLGEPRRLISLAEEVQPQIIVLDIMLPEIDGWELLGRLRTHPVLSDIPVVVATILPQEQLATALGAAAFLRKPVHRMAFLDALDAQFHSLRRKHLR